MYVLQGCLYVWVNYIDICLYGSITCMYVCMYHTVVCMYVLHECLSVCITWMSIIVYVYITRMSVCYVCITFYAFLNTHYRLKLTSKRQIHPHVIFSWLSFSSANLITCDIVLFNNTISVKIKRRDISIFLLEDIFRINEISYKR